MNQNRLSRDLEHILNHTHGLWENIRNQRIFITGGTGFIGAWLLESFLWANKALKLNAHAVVLTREPEKFKQRHPHLASDPAITLLAGDIRSYTLPNEKFTLLIHAATDASAALNRDNPALMYDTIVEGTRHTLNIAQQHHIPKMLFLSSGAVYGASSSEQFQETDACQPDIHSAYARGKYDAESLCQQQNNIDIKIARCFAFVGPYLPLEVHYAIGNFIHDALSGRNIIVKGDGTPQRSYLYSADMTIWLWHILFNGKSKYPYNVGSENAIAIAELATAVSNSFSPSPAVHVMGEPKPKQKIERYIPSTKRARTELGLKEWIDLTTAIQRTATWYQTK